MPAIDVNKLKQGGQRFLSGFTTGQKVVTGVALLFLMAGAFVFSSWESKPEMAPLYSNLSAEDASAVTQELDAQGVQYELANGGTAVLVPSDAVYSTRIALAGKNLPASGDSYALLDDESITSSDFKQRIDYQRALQGELGNTIMSMDNIGSAVVNLTLPRDDIFVSDENPQASASVLLRTNTGSDPPSGQIDAIVHLVTASVPDLTPDNVTISGENGKLYKSLGKDSGMQLGTRNFEAKVGYEQSVAQNIESMLARTLGPGAAVAAVSADLDFTKRQEQSTTHEGAGRNGQCLAAKSQTKSETYTGSGNSQAGILGPDGTPAGNTAGTPDQYENNSSATECANNETTTVAEQAPGEVKRLSVAVQLDDQAVEANQLQQYENSIAAAAGIDRQRGDVLSVTRVPMDKSVKEEASTALDDAVTTSGDGAAGIIRYVVTLLIVGLVLFFAWRAVKRSQLAAPVRVPLDLARIEASEARALATTPGGANYELEAAVARERELAAVAERVAELEASVPAPQREVAELIDRQPDEVAQTLRSWLADRRS